jgi:hypothetical protein
MLAREDSSDTLLDLEQEREKISDLERAAKLQSPIEFSEHLRYLLPSKLAFLPSDGESFEIFTRSATERGLKLISSKFHQQYWPLCLDFGPVAISVVWRFCILIRKALDREEKTGRPLVYCVENDGPSRANASFLLASFLMLDQKYSVDNAAAPFDGESAPFPLPAFRDATYTNQDFFLTLRDCLNGLATAVHHSWFDMTTFQLRQYEWLEAPDNGDIHQICPQMIAFKGPLPLDSHYRVPGEVALPPDHYAQVLKRMGAVAVVRLSEADAYDPSPFTAAGIAHHDLFFDDCAAPPPRIVDAFLAICDRVTSASPDGIGPPIAVHCRAGLGRTGTLIAAWLVRRRGFEPRAAIAWLRIVRPGSVIGPQQHYLISMVRPEGRHSVDGCRASGNSSVGTGAAATDGDSADDSFHPATGGSDAESDAEADPVAAAVAAAAAAAYARRLSLQVRSALALRGRSPVAQPVEAGGRMEAGGAAKGPGWGEEEDGPRRTRSAGSPDG